MKKYKFFSFEIFNFCNLQKSLNIAWTCFRNVFHSVTNSRQATANPVGGKACSPTRGGLLRYIPNTYSIHKVSSLKFAYFQGRLSRQITSPSEKTCPKSWPGNYMGKATPVWQLSLNVTKSRAEPQKPRRWKSMLTHQGWFTALYTQRLLHSQSLEFEICIFPREAIPSQ